jgi:hypothetical protein
MILFEEKIKYNKNAFLSKLKDISVDLVINPDWLMVLMNSETGGSFNPQIVNKQAASVKGYDENGKVVRPAGTPDSKNDFDRAKYRATGLIQFMPATAKHLGTTNQELYKLNNVQQLDYVHKYFLPVKGKIKGFEDLYLYAFYPYAVGKPDTYIIGSEKSMDYAKEIVKENPLDTNGDGVLSVSEFKTFLYKRIPKDALEALKKK